MSGSRFDEDIKRKLQDLKQDYDPMSWNVLSERLDTAGTVEQEEEHFDQKISETLENHRESPNHSDWLVMKEELALIQERKEKVVFSKFVEFVVILMLVLTFNKYRTLTFPQDRVNTLYAEAIEGLNQNAESIQANVAADPILESRFVDRLAKETFTESPFAAKPSIFNLTPLGSPQGIHESPQTQFTRDALPILGVDSKKNKNFEYRGINPLPVLTIDPLLVNIVLPKVPILQIYAFENRKKNMDGWSIGVPVSVDANFVNTNFNFNILKSQVKYGLSGISYGLTTAYRKNGLEIETGVEYSEKKFAPGLIRNYTESASNTLLEDELELVTLKQFQIPVLLKAYVAPHEKVSFYGTIGMAVNFLLDTDYDLKRQTVSANFKPASVIDEKILNLSEPPKGIFQGGSIQDNIYITAIAGFGIQQYFSNGFGWYIQPQYQHSLTRDLNEAASEVNSLSLELGIKYKL